MSRLSERSWRSGACLALLLCGACGDDGDKSNGSTSAIGNADCADPKENPYAEIACVTEFMGSCFMPAGACMGVVDTVSLGETTLTWESGDEVQATPYYDFAGIDFTDPEAAADAVKRSSGSDVTIKGANGGSCATGRSRLDQTGPDGKLCASHTVYTNNAGQTLTYCFDEGGSGTVTCSSNGMSYPIKNGNEASNCQSGSTASGQCEIEVTMPSQQNFGPQFPGT
jgi:hypothetical protein